MHPVKLFLLLLPVVAFAQNPSSKTALLFNGASDWVRVEDHASLNPQNQITLEAWVFSEQFDRSSWQEFIMKGGNNPGGGEPRQYYLRPRKDDGRLEFKLHDLNDEDKGESSDSSLTNGLWYHVAATYDGAVIRLYINGQHADSDSESVTIQVSDQPLAFGRLGSVGAEYFSGIMDEIRIWNIARSGEELRRTMKDTLGPQYYNSADSGLVGYWRFDEAGGDSTYDLSVYENHGQVIGASFVESGAFTTIADNASILLHPRLIRLLGNYPNPFNPGTTIRYNLGKRTELVFEVFDITGKIVEKRSLGLQGVGDHSLIFDANNLTSGIYYYRLRGQTESASGRMLLIK